MDYAAGAASTPCGHGIRLHKLPAEGRHVVQGIYLGVELNNIATFIYEDLLSHALFAFLAKVDNDFNSLLYLWRLYNFAIDSILCVDGCSADD